MTAPTASTTALLMLDYEVALTEQGPHAKMPPLIDQVEQRGVIATAGRVLAAARAAGARVIHVRLAFDDAYGLRTNQHPRFDGYPNNRAMLATSPEAAFTAPLAPTANETVVQKGGVDPFIGTALTEILIGAGIRTVVLGGVATNLVVESAARTACDKGFQVRIVEDMCASFDPELHRLSFEKLMPLFGKVTTADEVIVDEFAG
ncbi:isochorismatase family cysteine hydrolase [Propionibacteriaceae bacterium G57]|uniref:isochorismatase family cysteine hydrolase n=1 Tax=Aestuariimicrobium sp. G57 TaxID=3418485 RepID=UPI003DA6EF0C